MEIAQLSKSIFNNQLQQPTYLCDKRNMSPTCIPTPPNQCPYQVSTSYILRFLGYNPNKILKVKLTKARSNVKSRSHHDVAHLHLPNQCPYKVSTSYTLWMPRYSLDKILKVRSLQLNQRSTPGQPPKYHFPTPYSS